MSAAFTASTPALAKLSAPARSQVKQRRRAQAAVVTTSSSSGVVHNGKKTANNNSIAAASLARRVALGAATVTVPLTTIAQPAHAMEGALAVFNGNPALTLGMMVLTRKEAAGRAKCEEWGVDVSDVEEGNWGRIRERVKQEAKRRGVDMPKL